MKTLGRILIILIAAAVVIGVSAAILQTSAAQVLVGQPMGEGESTGRSGPPDFTNGQGAPAGEMRGDHDGRGGSWETVGRNLLQITAIVAAVQVVWSIGRWIKRSAERHNRVAIGRSS